MAQTTDLEAGRAISRALRASNLAVAVAGTGNTDILSLPTEGMNYIGVEVKPTVHALDAFVISVQFCPDGDYVALYSAGGSYTSPVGLLVAASGDLTALAANATGWFVLEVRGIYRVKVSVSGAADGTLVDVFAGGA